MATYNGASFIAEQLDSLRRQTLKPYELIISDDGSSDSTLTICQEFAAHAPFPVRVSKNARRLGYADNFLNAATIAQGEWISFCDQDDIWLPHKLATIQNELGRQDKNVNLFAHPALIIDQSGTATGEIAWPSNKCTYPIMGFPIWKGSMGCGQTFHKSLLDIPFSKRFIVNPTSMATAPHDEWIIRISQCLGSARYTNEPLILRRRHSKSETANNIPRDGGLSGDRADSFVRYSEMARSRGQTLIDVSTSLDRECSARLARSGHFYLALSEVLSKRSEIGDARTIDQLSTFGNLLVDKRYWKSPRGRFQVRSALSDAMYIARRIRLK